MYCKSYTAKSYMEILCLWVVSPAVSHVSYTTHCRRHGSQSYMEYIRFPCKILLVYGICMVKLTQEYGICITNLIWNMYCKFYTAKSYVEILCGICIVKLTQEYGICNINLTQQYIIWFTSCNRQRHTWNVMCVWASECVSEWVSEWVSVYMNVYICMCVCVCVYTYTYYMFQAYIAIHYLITSCYTLRRMQPCSTLHLTHVTIMFHLTPYTCYNYVPPFTWHMFHLTRSTKVMQ
jgi:hypothetical protein